MLRWLPFSIDYLIVERNSFLMIDEKYLRFSFPCRFSGAHNTHEKQVTEVGNRIEGLRSIAFIMTVLLNGKLIHRFILFWEPSYSIYTSFCDRLKAFYLTNCPSWQGMLLELPVELLQSIVCWIQWVLWVICDNISAPLYSAVTLRAVNLSQSSFVFNLNTRTKKSFLEIFLKNVKDWRAEQRRSN